MTSRATTVRGWRQGTLAAMDEQTIESDTAARADDDVEVVEELLIEEISIDGMCGVY